MKSTQRTEKCVFQFGSRCHALKTKECENCRFYKTSRQYEESRARALERICGLDEEQQEHIRFMYYSKSAVPAEVTG